MFFDITTKHIKSIKSNTNKKPLNKNINYYTNQTVPNTLVRNDTMSSNNIGNLVIKNMLDNKLVHKQEKTNDNLNPANNLLNTNDNINITNNSVNKDIYSENKIETQFKCKICAISLCSLTSFRNHCCSQQHISALSNINSKNIQSSLPEKLNHKTYKCIVCNIEVKSMSSYRYHCTSKNHLQTVNKLCMETSIINNANVASNVAELQCDICGKCFCNKGNVTRHKKNCKPK